MTEIGHLDSITVTNQQVELFLSESSQSDIQKARWFRIIFRNTLKVSAVFALLVYVFPAKLGNSFLITVFAIASLSILWFTSIKREEIGEVFRPTRLVDAQLLLMRYSTEKVDDFFYHLIDHVQVMQEGRRKHAVILTYRNQLHRLVGNISQEDAEHIQQWLLARVNWIKRKMNR